MHLLFKYIMQFLNLDYAQLEEAFSQLDFC